MSRIKVINLFESAGFIEYPYGFLWNRLNANGVYIWVKPYRNGFSFVADSFDNPYWYGEQYIAVEDLSLEAINNAVKYLISTNENASLNDTECYA